MAQLHLRIIVPSDRTAAVRTLLIDHKGVTNVMTLTGAAQQPPGDVVMCDVVRESANDVLEALEERGVEEQGSISLEHVDVAASQRAERAKLAAPGEGDDAVVWEEFAGRVDDTSRLTWSYVAFLSIAVQIAAIGILLESPILIVGAMVLGPEFGPIAALSFGVLRREWWRIELAVRTLVIGYFAAVAVTWCCAFTSFRLGWIAVSWVSNLNAETEFIIKPDRWSFIVAVLAGVAGILSLTSDKSSALVGVFISVTTVPAASYIAVSVAMGRWDGVGMSALQLLLNIGGIFLAGIVTLLVLRLVWGQAGLGVRLHRHRGRR